MLWLLLACHHIPDAPEGLDDSTKYLLQNFWADDDTVSAGLTGLMDWYDDEGRDLIGVTVNPDNVEGFLLADLSDGDVAAIPDPTDGSARDPSAAKGVVGLGEVACAWGDAEALQVRPDQVAVFEGSFDSYDRSFVTSRDAYEGASGSGDYDAVDDPLDARGQVDWDAVDQTFLLTENHIVATAIGVTIAYDMNIHFRHGLYEIQGEDRSAFLLLTWLAEPSDDGTLLQTYRIEADVDEGDRTLRLSAAWSQIDSPMLSSDDTTVQTAGANQIISTSERMSDLCTGDATVDGRVRARRSRRGSH